MRFRRQLNRHPFEARLKEIRARVQPEPFRWYPFDTMANLTAIETLLPGGVEAFVTMARQEPVADIGSGDGDLAFLLESEGCDVTAFDWPGTNANQMAGIRLMKQELGSNLSIKEINVDDQFRLDGERYGMAVFLGLLYHLKNPWYPVEKLAVHSRRMLLSTRILPRGSTSEPLARLTREREFEDDPTNYWLFSESGLLRMLDRCGWDVLSHRIFGDGRDDRLFCLAESKIAKSRQTIRLTGGWHEIENQAWRWSTGEFGATISGGAGARRLRLEFQVVPELLVQGPLTVSGELSARALPAQTITSPGKHVYECEIPPVVDDVSVAIRLSHTFREGDRADGRDLGVIVHLPLDTIVDDECGMRVCGAG